VTDIVKKILENSKFSSEAPSARQLFYRQFDSSLRTAEREKNAETTQKNIDTLEAYGEAAKISAGEISRRKMILLWTLTQG